MGGLEERPDKAPVHDPVLTPDASPGPDVDPGPESTAATPTSYIAVYALVPGLGTAAGPGLVPASKGVAHRSSFAEINDAGEVRTSPEGATKQQALRVPEAKGREEVRVMRVETLESPYNGRTL